MSDLDKKLEEILELAQSYIDDENVQGRARDVAISALKQAFIDEGWVRAAESKAFRDRYMVMTGQEWYDRFNKACEEHTSLDWWSVFDTAARKAAGIE